MPLQLSQPMRVDLDPINTTKGKGKRGGREEERGEEGRRGEERRGEGERGEERGHQVGRQQQEQAGSRQEREIFAHGLRHTHTYTHTHTHTHTHHKCYLK